MDDAELGRLVDAALEAGSLILKVYARPDHGKRDKTDGSPVTEADGLAEAAILLRLARDFPGVPVVAEEAVAAGLVPATGDRFFLVDPLDGTREFVDRNGDFTVNIALVEHGRPTIGVILAPTHGLLFVGRVGRGAQMAEVASDRAGPWCSIRAEAARWPLRVVASRSHLTPASQGLIEALPEAVVSRVGSSLKFCRIAAGKADLYPCLGPTSQWDTAAGEAILTAAGGRVTRMDGSLLSYGATEAGFLNPHFLASGAFDATALVAP